ncbi:MAG: PEPxxWA-CTERM sorting domain-containing protein [Sphingomicrobium sp.]
MRTLTFSILASAAALAMSSSASAQTVVEGQGPNFATHISASTSNTQNNNIEVYGSTTGVGGADVLFTGNTQIHITSGNGFASITDSTDETHTGVFTSLIINPEPLFSALQFNLSLEDGAFLQIDYSYGGGVFLNAINGVISQNGNANTGYTISGGNTPFDAIRLTSCLTSAICNTAIGVGSGNGAPINFERQNSINVAVTAAVPEPSTWAMMLFGFGAMGVALRRRKQATSLMQMA